MSEKLKYAYSLKSTKDTIQLYKIWSKTYDENFALNNNYKSPQNIVKYFNQYSNIGDFPILDVGAGTGLVGEYLKKYCSTIIHALDISNDMLNIAKQKECYEKIVRSRYWACAQYCDKFPVFGEGNILTRINIE